MPKKQHIHKYQLRSTEFRPVWACALPGCNHFMPPHLTSLVAGRTSICWECDQQFTMDVITMSQPKPFCQVCLGIENDLVFSPAQIALSLKLREETKTEIAKSKESDLKDKPFDPFTHHDD